MKHLLSTIEIRNRYLPEKTFISDESDDIVFEEFVSRVVYFSKYLKNLGIAHGDRIVIYLPRGINAVICVCAVLSLGAIYVPLDTKLPSNRINHVIADADASITIGISRKPSWLRKEHQWINYSKHQKNKLDPNNFSIEVKNKDGSDIAAILYTSGSTGLPKGVTLSHRAMIAFSDWAGKRFKINQDDKIASLAPLQFDLSVFDIFTSLRFNASIQYIPSHLTMSPSRLTRWLLEKEITVWYTVPSMLKIVAKKGNLNKTPLKNLRTILFAGEVMPIQPLRELASQLIHTKFYNLFGPTETNVCCYWKVDKKRLSDLRFLPIGKPISGVKLKISSDNNELLVKSPTLMSGYWDKNGIDPCLDSKGWYHTGDVVSKVNGKNFNFHGRLSRMIKVNGYRIEPAEIEYQISQFPGVQECSVLGLSHNNRFIVAACVAGLDKCNIKTLKDVVSKKLPNYMIPEKFHFIENLPKLNNGKYDLKKIESYFTFLSK